MPIFSNDECDMIEKHAESFTDWLKKNFVVKLQAQIGYKLPSEVDNILAKLSSLGNHLKKRNTGGAMKESHDIPEESAPLIKRIVIHQRRIVASRRLPSLSRICASTGRNASFDRMVSWWPTWTSTISMAFNTRHTETKIDRDLLPRFMELMESHLYAHGQGYRYGWDEYILLLPNFSLSMGVGFIKEFQAKLRMISYRGIAERPTISVGAHLVPHDCFLTEREIEDRANRAKNYAKKNGKNCIATYKGEYYSESELVVVK